MIVPSINESIYDLCIPTFATCSVNHVTQYIVAGSSMLIRLAAILSHFNQCRLLLDI